MLRPGRREGNPRLGCGRGRKDPGISVRKNESWITRRRLEFETVEGRREDGIMGEKE